MKCLLEGKADFEWSAARETTEVSTDHHLNGNQVEEESDDNSNDKTNEDASNDEKSNDRKRPFQTDSTLDDSSLLEKRSKKDEEKETNKADEENSTSNSDSKDCPVSEIPEDTSDGEETTALWTSFDIIKPRIMKSEPLPDLEKFWRPVIESNYIFCPCNFYYIFTALLTPLFVLVQFRQFDYDRHYILFIYICDSCFSDICKE